MKYHIYLNSEKNYILRWNDRPLEFDDYVSANDFLRSVIVTSCQEEEEFCGVEIIKDELIMSPWHDSPLNATHLRVAYAVEYEKVVLVEAQ